VEEIGEDLRRAHIEGIATKTKEQDRGTKKKKKDTRCLKRKRGLL